MPSQAINAQLLSKDLAFAEPAAEASLYLKLLANPDRLRLACALAEGEKSVRALEDGLALRQPGLSQQLASLRQAGLIQGRKEGKHIFYHLSDPKAAELIAAIYHVFCAPSVE